MSANANCILLNVRGNYYYAEEFGKFIEIEKSEYDQILNNPHLYYFSTALKKHLDWCAAVGKATTLTFSDALGQTHDVIGSPDGEIVSPAKPNEPSSETGSDTRKPTAFPSRFRQMIDESATRLTNWTISVAAVTALLVILASHKASAPKHPADIAIAQPLEIRRAIRVVPEIRKAIPARPEIRKAIPVQARAAADQ